MAKLPIIGTKVKDWQATVIYGIAIIVGLNVLFGIDVLNMLQTGSTAPASAAPTTTVPITGVGLQCPIDDLYLDVMGRDVYNPGTEVLARAYAWVIGSDGSRHEITAVNATGDDDFTLSPGDTLEILVIEDPGDLSTAQGGPDAYGVLKTYVVPCAGQDFLSFDLARHSTSYAAGTNSITVTIVNTDGVTANSFTNSEAMAASATYQMSFKMRAESERCYGAPGLMNTACFEVNDTTIKDVEVKSMVYDGTSYGSASEVSKPSTETTSADMLDTCFEVPSVCDSKELTGIIVIETESTQPAEDENITLTLYDVSHYIDADDNTPKTGIEDEDGNDVGIGLDDQRNVTINLD